MSGRVYVKDRNMPSLLPAPLREQPCPLPVPDTPHFPPRSTTKSLSSVMVGGTWMEMLTWPIPLVFCSMSRTLESEPDTNVAETLTGTSEASEPDISRTRAWRRPSERGIIKAVWPTPSPRQPCPSKRNLQQEGGPGHEMLLGAAEIQGEGRRHEAPGCELRLLHLSSCTTEGRDGSTEPREKETGAGVHLSIR